jgi:methionyl-tRNA synthetase
MSVAMAYKSYLITPMQPTPNGRVHIGHGGGTYLRADVLARALRVRGADVSVVCGTDAYENWVLAEAQRIGLDVVETCSRYHHLIRADLELLGIPFDAWVDPLDDDHGKDYVDLHERIFYALRRCGAASLEVEQVPFTATTGRATVGVWLAGRCPRCDADAQGSTCVRCGSHFQPEELHGARSRLDDEPIEWRPRQHWFVRPGDPEEILTAARATGLRPDVRAAAERYVQETGGRIRLTGPGDWGIRTAMTPTDGILANPYFLYSVYCGEVDRARRGGANPFEPGSGVTTIGVFGSDNTVPGVVAPWVIAQALPELVKPFDRVVVNGMLNVEGCKCSTSKRHGIWLAELLGNTSITADELRWTVSQSPLDHGPADLSLNDLVDQVNQLRAWTLDLARRLLDLEGRSVTWTPDLDRMWDAGPGRFDPGRTPVTAMADELRELLTVATAADPGTLLLLTLVAAPLLPDLSAALWRQLGQLGDPDLETARHSVGFVRGAVEPGLDPAAGRAPVTVAEISPYVHRGR